MAVYQSPSEHFVRQFVG